MQKKTIMQISRENENLDAYSTYTWNFLKKSFVLHLQEKIKEKKEYSEKSLIFHIQEKKHERKENVVKK